MKVYLLSILTLTGLMMWQIMDERKETVTDHTAETRAIEGELSRVKSVFFTSDGKRLYFLESDRFNYFTDESRVDLGSLRLLYTATGGKTIMLASDSGKILDGGNTIELRGEVIIRRRLSDVEVDESANTRDIIIDTPAKMAETDAYTIIKRKNQVLAGDGLEVDLVQAKMKLLRNVKMRDAN